MVVFSISVLENNRIKGMLRGINADVPAGGRPRKFCRNEEMIGSNIQTVDHVYRQPPHKLLQNPVETNDIYH